jgi:hypothetical protein
MRPIILGLTGYKRSGKTTVAEHLCDAHGFFHESFADPIRVAVADILGLSMRELEAAKETPIAWLDGATPRKMMQTLGTEWGREMIHSELWIRACQRRIQTAIDRGQSVVISDVRFRNEADAIRSLGGKIVRVVRPDCTGDSHASEAEIPLIVADYLLPNEWGVRTLRSNTDYMLLRFAEEA